MAGRRESNAEEAADLLPSTRGRSPPSTPPRANSSTAPPAYANNHTHPSSSSSTSRDRHHRGDHVYATPVLLLLGTLLLLLLLAIAAAGPVAAPLDPGRDDAAETKPAHPRAWPEPQSGRLPPDPTCRSPEPDSQAPHAETSSRGPASAATASLSGRLELYHYRLAPAAPCAAEAIPAVAAPPPLHPRDQTTHNPPTALALDALLIITWHRPDVRSCDRAADLLQATRDRLLLRHDGGRPRVDPGPDSKPDSSPEPRHRAAPHLLGCAAYEASPTPTTGGVHLALAFRLAGLAPGRLTTYWIGEELPRTFISPPLPGSAAEMTSILVVGDTSPEDGKPIFSAAHAGALASAAANWSLFLHLGDASYASNNGECRTAPFELPPGSPCDWDCRVNCSVDIRNSVSTAERHMAWARDMDASVGGRVVTSTVMGNHDNDVGWFLTYRPPLASAAPGIRSVADLASPMALLPPPVVSAALGSSPNPLEDFVLDRLREPFYFSFDHGLAHIVTIGTEDNPINAYERWDGQPHSARMKARFERSFGRSSPQFKWLARELAEANRPERRARVPWVVLVTHRPLYHTARNHAMCAAGGDWYGCLFLELYEPLLLEHRVDLVLTGHSHHVARTFPMAKFRRVRDHRERSEHGIVHLLVGTGGPSLIGNDWVDSPEWMAFRDGTKLGYGSLHVLNRTAAAWRFVEVPSGNVLDEAWVVRSDSVR